MVNRGGLFATTGVLIATAYFGGHRNTQRTGGDVKSRVAIFGGK
jgi:hypothetical protein